jgi:hypothetical protein
MKNNPCRFNQPIYNSVYLAISLKSGFRPWVEISWVRKIWILGKCFGKSYSKAEFKSFRFMKYTLIINVETSSQENPTIFKVALREK